MSTITQTPAGGSSSSSLASSAKFRTFALVFGMATPVLYVICDMQNWPLFTYHPGPNRIDFGYAAAVRDQGPAMYWYGWTCTTLIGAAVLGFLATLLPESTARKIPLSLTWILPIVALPILIYSLAVFWRW
jgi:hypothetical protein